MYSNRCALAVAVAVWMAIFTAAAETQEDRDAYEKRITAELEKLNPKALPVFLEANQVRKTGDFKKAAELYGKVRKMAPGYVHAIRRQCQAELELGRRDQAVELCRAAVAKDESWENLTSLSMALSSGSGGLPKDLVRHYIHSHRNGIKFCYEQGLMRKPRLHGKVVVAFTIGSSGRVVKALIQETSLKHRRVEACMLSRIKRWIFPQPPKGNEVVVIYPFILKPVGKKLR